MDKIKSGWIYVSSQTKEVTELLAKGDVGAWVGVSVVGLASLLVFGLILMTVNVWLKGRKQKAELKKKSLELSKTSKVVEDSSKKYTERVNDKHAVFRKRHVLNSFEKILKYEIDVIKTLEKSFPVQSVDVGDEVILLGVGTMQTLQGCVGKVLSLHRKGVWVVEVPKQVSDKEGYDSNILYLYRHEFEVTKKQQPVQSNTNTSEKKNIEKGDFVIVNPDETEVSALEYIQMRGVVCEVVDVIEHPTHPYQLKIPEVCSIILGTTHIHAQEKEVELFSKKQKPVESNPLDNSSEEKIVGYCSFKRWENGKLVSDIKKKF